MKLLPNEEKIRAYFENRLAEFGETPRGADWNSVAAQETRFDQLLKVCDAATPFSLLDYGCGVGALADYLVRRGFEFSYLGFDLLETAITKALQMHTAKNNTTFTSHEAHLHPQDYAVASGIFNIRLETSQEDWRAYVVETLDKLNALSNKGFAFNLLTSYSDPEYLRPHLYYADPCFFFDYCKTHFSRNVALLHDYELYDFTILVRK